MTELIEGFQLIRLARTDSTNNFAAKLRESGSVSGPAAILADEQTNGRGQRGATWESEPGANLTCSLMPEERIHPSLVYRLNMRASVSICQAIEPYLAHAQVQIKWPNDVLINRRKVAGILVENQVEGDAVRSIIGMGVNLNQFQFSVPSAVSLSYFSGQHHDTLDTMQQILSVWKSWDAHPETLQREYMSRLLGTESAEPYEDATRRFHATIQAVSPEGVLTLCEGDQCRDYREKEVRWLGTQN